MQLWFKSDRFDIEQDEESNTNPHCYGRQLASWLAEKLSAAGYASEAVAEDWGWCVICSRKPFLLWVACGNVHDAETGSLSGRRPEGSELIWTCFVEAEPRLFDRIFKRHDTGPATKQLFNEVRRLLATDAGVLFVDEP